MWFIPFRPEPSNWSELASETHPAIKGYCRWLGQPQQPCNHLLPLFLLSDPHSGTSHSLPSSLTYWVIPFWCLLFCWIEGCRFFCWGWMVFSLLLLLKITIIICFCIILGRFNEKRRKMQRISVRKRKIILTKCLLARKTTKRHQ